MKEAAKYGRGISMVFKGYGVSHLGLSARILNIGVILPFLPCMT